MTLSLRQLQKSFFASIFCFVCIYIITDNYASFIYGIGRVTWNPPQKYANKNNDDCSCLNDIFDEILVISIKERINTLRLTLYQLGALNIKYTLWTGHSPNDSQSILLWTQFKDAVNDATRSNRNHTVHQQMKSILYRTTNLYYNKFAFLLRETQIDILKYAKTNNLNKILILEDDILLSNADKFQLFCEIEPYLPEWYVLSIGVNQFLAQKYKPILNDILYHENYEIKYSIKDQLSFGAFGVAISHKMLSTLINIFDFNASNAINLNLYPFDNYYRFIENNVKIKNKCFNIHPTLILPDVTHSMMRKPRDQYKYVKYRTTDHDFKHFSKFWNLRFSEGFDKLILDSPSNEYLRRNRTILQR